ncbi:MAG: TonB family protein [Elusimicrobia bacterium]|nr:TonB family protein [Elusimicrobiota bacterium]
MAEARIPASVVVSLGLHGGLLVFFGLMMREGPKQAAKVVEGVDLIVNAPRPKAVEGAPKPPPLSTMDFLKLALPAPTRAAAPAQLSVKIEEHKVKLAEPKLEDRAKRDAGPKLEALDMSEHRVETAKLDVKIDHRRAAQTLAALPRLEEVGRKRVKNLPEALALEDRRREAVAAAGLPRRIASYSVPPFPSWARSQGILEADVAIRFTVDEDGAVMPGMRITSSSGYGRLDKLAMESLKTWRFVPKPGAGVQWGVITFRFVTE